MAYKLLIPCAFGWSGSGIHHEDHTMLTSCDLQVSACVLFGAR